MAEEQIKGGDSVDFSQLLLGFGSAALTHMGFQSDGSIDKQNQNLVLAKQNIDIIELLKEKTKGNLSLEEAKLTDQILADLQMRYVAASK